METAEIEERPSRGHKKRARTRGQLIEAGVCVLAEKGDAFTVSDVVARAEVSNGTFYNYFRDREALIDAVAEHSLVALVGRAALETREADPAIRFAIATAYVLRRAQEDTTWGRAVLRLADHRRSVAHELHHHLRADLAEGFERGRFEFGPDEDTLDLIIGLLMMSIRRIVRGEAGPDTVERVVARALVALGLSPDAASAVVNSALAERHTH